MSEHEETPFAEWTYEHARAALDEAIEDVQGGREAFESNRLYVEEGDHWQKGATWPGAGGVDAAVRKKVLAAVEPQFTPSDAIGECVGRFVSALLRTEPALSFTPVDLQGEEEPSEEQRRAAEEMLADVSRWWDRKQLMWELRAALRRSRWAQRGAVRLWLNEKAYESPRQEGEEGDDATQEDGERRLRQGLDFADALDLIEVSGPEPSAAVVYTHPRTRREAAVFFFEVDEQKRAEITYLDADGRTVFRVVEEGGGEAELSDPLELGGRLAVVEMDAPLLITEAVRRQQAKLNFLETLGLRVGETAGFPERYTTNAEPHGIWLATPPSEGPPLKVETDPETGQKWYLHPAPRPLGPAITTDLRGIVVDEERGTVATPGVSWKDPTDPEFVNGNSDHTKRRLYEEVKQLHVTISGDATASGRSREQARADFEDDLNDVRPELEALIRRVVEGAIALASTLSSERGEFLERFRAVVNVHASSGPISPEERQENTREAEKGLLSKESAMAANGVEDVAAEKAAIAAQPDYRLELRKRQAEVMQTILLARPDMPVGVAARFAGLDEEEDAEILTAFESLRGTEAL